MAVVQFALFLSSGTFVPIGTHPAAMQVVVQVTHLYHGVELTRALTTGVVGWGHLWHVVYLMVATMLGLVVAGRRMNRLLTR